MANSYLEALERAQLLLREQYEGWAEIDTKLLSIISKVQSIGGVSDTGSLKELNSVINEQVKGRKDINAVIQQQEAQIKSLRDQLAKLNSTSKESISTEQKLKETREKSLSKEWTGRMKEHVESIGKTNDELKKMSAYYKEVEKASAKAAAASAKASANSPQAKLDNKVLDSYKKLNEARSEETKIIEQNRVAAAQARKEARDQAKSIQALDSAYGAASQKLRAMTKEYSDLAIRKELDNDLTTEQIKRMDLLATEIDQMRGALVTVDHRVGNFGRSVGSYGKQFDSLGFSIAQVTRELPAFAYGAQIGFAALSNNIPILVDEIEKVRTQIKGLRAEGKATKSVMSTLASSFFGFQTLLSIGVTLLTLYGAKLIEAASDAFDFKTEAEKLTEALEKMNEDLEKYIENLDDVSKAQLEGTKSAQEELLTLQLLNGAVQDTTKSEEERKGALDELRKLYPEHLQNMTDEEILTKGLGESYKTLAEGILTAAKAQAAFDIMAENSRKLMEVELALSAKQLKRVTTQKEINRLQEEFDKKVNKAYVAENTAESKLYDDLLNAKSAAAELSDEINLLTGEQQKLEIANINLAESIENVDFLMSAAPPGGDSPAKRAKIELEELVVAQKYTVAYWEQVISALQKSQTQVSRNSQEWQNYQKAIEEAQKAIAVITDLQQFARDELSLTSDELKNFSDTVVSSLTVKGIDQGMKDLADITGESLEDLTKQFHNFYENDFESFMEFYEAKMSKREEEKEKIKELQNEILDAAIGLTNAIFEGEIEKVELRIEANKDYYAQLLDNAELTEERRSALEAERDAKERKLMKEKRKREREQFLFEKAVALAETTIYVAKTITEYGILSPVAILAGILGAIQIATIAAQTIPKFAGGTFNAKEGMAIVDEIRPEVHTDKYGNVKSFGSEKGANFRFLEQGDRVYKSREEYFSKLQDNQIENVIWSLNMKHQGRPISERDVSEAVVREISALRGENSRIWREVKKLASRPINNNVTVEVPDNRPY